MAIDVGVTSLDDDIADDPEMLARVEEFKQELVEFKEAKRAAFPRDLRFGQGELPGRPRLHVLPRGCLGGVRRDPATGRPSPRCATRARASNPSAWSATRPGYQYKNGYAEEPPVQPAGQRAVRGLPRLRHRARARRQVGGPGQGFLRDLPRQGEQSRFRLCDLLGEDQALAATGAASLAVVAAGWPALSWARPVRALDVFTLWRQPEIPLQHGRGRLGRLPHPGHGRRPARAGPDRASPAWTGRRTDDGSWLLEMLPLDEDATAACTPLPGEGVRLRLSRDLLSREGTLAGRRRAKPIQWRDGQADRISPGGAARRSPGGGLPARGIPSRPVAEAGPHHPRDRQRHPVPVRPVRDGGRRHPARRPAGRPDDPGHDPGDHRGGPSPSCPSWAWPIVTERIRAESRLDPPSRRISAAAAPDPGRNHGTGGFRHRRAQPVLDRCRLTAPRVLWYNAFMISNDLKQFRAEAHDFLLGQQKPLPTPAIARRLFGARRHEMPETQVVVRALLADDPRFVETHDHCWTVLGFAAPAAAAGRRPPSRWSTWRPPAA